MLAAEFIHPDRREHHADGFKSFPYTTRKRIAPVAAIILDRGQFLLMFATETKTAVTLTDTAIIKVREILDMQDPKPTGLRISVVGGGCSGFSYSMAFETAPGLMDKVYTFEDLKVYVDQASLLYLDGARVDYVEGLEGSGFKFENPNVKSTCGCGSSFSA